MTLQITAPAKINLSLNITGKRDDGYHLLHSIVGFTDFGDEITLEDSNAFSFHMTGNFSASLEKENNNLVTQVIEKLVQRYDKSSNFKVTLNKNLPVGSGVGSGSSDAAATVKALLHYWNIEEDQKLFDDFLPSIGADVPVCYHGAVCIMEGIGEKIRPFPALNVALPILLVFPNIHCSTQKIFSHLNTAYSDQPQEPGKFNDIEAFINFLAVQNNDLKETAIELFPIIQNALSLIKEQPHCYFSQMSGSGSTCFGIFKTKKSCQEAALSIQSKYPDWWVKSTDILL